MKKILCLLLPLVLCLSLCACLPQLPFFNPGNQNPGGDTPGGTPGGDGGTPGGGGLPAVPFTNETLAAHLNTQLDLFGDGTALNALLDELKAFEGEVQINTPGNGQSMDNPKKNMTFSLKDGILFYQNKTGNTVVATQTTTTYVTLSGSYAIVIQKAPNGVMTTRCVSLSSLFEGGFAGISMPLTIVAVTPPDFTADDFVKDGESFTLKTSYIAKLALAGLNAIPEGEGPEDLAEIKADLPRMVDSMGLVVRLDTKDGVITGIHLDIETNEAFGELVQNDPGYVIKGEADVRFSADGKKLSSLLLDLQVGDELDLDLRVETAENGLPVASLNMVSVSRHQEEGAFAGAYFDCTDKTTVSLNLDMSRAGLEASENTLLAGTIKKESTAKKTVNGTTVTMTPAEQAQYNKNETTTIASSRTDSLTDKITITAPDGSVTTVSINLKTAPSFQPMTSDFAGALADAEAATAKYDAIVAYLKANKKSGSFYYKMRDLCYISFTYNSELASASAFAITQEIPAGAVEVIDVGASFAINGAPKS